MPLGDAQDFVDGFDPIPCNCFAPEEGAEDIVQRSMQALGFTEESAGALRVDLRKSEQLSAALGGNDARDQEKAEQVLPGEIRGRP